MAEVVLYGTLLCPYCIGARALLRQLDIPYRSVWVGWGGQRAREMLERSGRTSVPQIFVGKHHVGGYDELESAASSPLLRRLLSEAS